MKSFSPKMSILTNLLLSKISSLGPLKSDQLYDQKKQIKLLILMSTLPQIFRNSNSGYLPPAKQGGIFAIKYKQPNKFESLHQKFSQSRIGTSCTNRTQRTNRHSVSFGQRPFSRQQLNEQPIGYASSKMSMIIHENKPNVEQADSLKHTLLEQISKMKQNNKKMQVLISQREKLAEDMSQLRQNCTHECQFIQKQFQKNISQLKNMLSKMRRQSGMELKDNRQQANKLEDDLKIVEVVLNDIKQKVEQIQDDCIK